MSRQAFLSPELKGGTGRHHLVLLYLCSLENGVERGSVSGLEGVSLWGCSSTGSISEHGLGDRQVMASDSWTDPEVHGSAVEVTCALCSLQQAGEGAPWDPGTAETGTAVRLGALLLALKSCLFSRYVTVL